MGWCHFELAHVPTSVVLALHLVRYGTPSGVIYIKSQMISCRVCGQLLPLINWLNCTALLGYMGAGPPRRAELHSSHRALQLADLEDPCAARHCVFPERAERHCKVFLIVKKIC